MYIVACERPAPELGSPDILVNNAGIDMTSRVAEMPVAMWDEMRDINLRSVFLCTRLVLPDMVQRRWGRIINTAFQLAHKGAADMAHYAAPKASDSLVLSPMKWHHTG
jgi:3-oxoacyl-[acyl-carrier protein] reductase